MTDKSRVRQNLLPLGFALIILLMIALTVIGVNRMQYNNMLMEEVVTQYNVKVELVRNMYVFARERSVLLLRMMVSDDPFEKDELSIELDRMAGKFIAAREELKQKKLDAYESKLIDQHAELVRWVAPLQREVADLIIQDELDLAREFLLEKAIPGQNQVLVALEKILAYERKQAKNALHQANQVATDTINFMTVLAFSIIAISLVIAFWVTRISYRNQRLLLHAKYELEERVHERTIELEKLRDEAMIANQHKSEFLANMSHELRTPLNAVIGFSQMLKRQVFGDLNEKQLEYVDDIHSSGSHLLSLINDILDLSKVEAGRMELQISQFDLHDSILSAISLFKEKASKHGIKISTEIDENINSVSADERKIKQIVLNLVSNAMKFTPEEGKVSVTASKEDGLIRVSVSDSGVGISVEDQSVIFEEFHQGSSEHAKKKEGTGLGLALSKKFVEMHGGKIWVQSELGKGTTFTFIFPEDA